MSLLLRNRIYQNLGQLLKRDHRLKSKRNVIHLQILRVIAKLKKKD